MFFQNAPDIEVLSANGEACPICGEPGTNCKGETDFGTMTFLPAKPIDDPLATFTVPERIFTEKQVGSRKIRTLLYAKGARIRPEEARRLGLLRDNPVAT